ncbi:MAG: membrane protein insertase YidC, partial [Acidimicrobiia bacterium]
MERRVFIAVLLSFAVLYTYQALMRRFSTPPSPVTQARKTLPPAQRPEKQTQEKVEQPLTSAGIPAPSALVADSEEQNILVENDVIRVTFSNRGAQVRSWILKRYNGVNGRPLDLVPDKLPADAPRPFSIKTDSEQTNARIERALFKPSATRLDLTSTSGTLTFDYTDSSGLEVQKEFAFSPGSYLVQVNVSVVDSQGAVNPTIQWGPGIGEIASDKSQYVQEPQGVVCRDGSVVRVAGSKSAVFEEKLECAGIEDHYFLSAVLPGGQVAKAEFQPYVLETGSTSKPLVAYRVRVAGGSK